MFIKDKKCAIFMTCNELIFSKSWAFHCAALVQRSAVPSSLVGHNHVTGPGQCNTTVSSGHGTVAPSVSPSSSQTPYPRTWTTMYRQFTTAGPTQGTTIPDFYTEQSTSTESAMPRTTAKWDFFHAILESSVCIEEPVNYKMPPQVAYCTVYVMQSYLQQVEIVNIDDNDELQCCPKDDLFGVKDNEKTFKKRF